MIEVGEDEGPDMGYGVEEEEEELVPIISKSHRGLFGADLSSVNY